MNNKLVMFLAGLFTLVGILFLVGAYYDWQSNQRITQTGIETNGVVVEMRHGRAKKHKRPSTAQAPVVQFKTIDGKPITYYSQMFTTPARFEVGETVRLWYLPENPQENVTLAGADIWLVTAMFVGLGILFSLAGCWLVIVSIRRYRKLKAIV